MRPEVADDVYGPRERAAAARLAAIGDRLEAAEVILGSWGLPAMDDAFLARAPHLRLVLYAAGSVRGFVTDAFWERGIRVSSAQAVNAAFVAEYTLAAILISLKQGWRFMRGAPASRSEVPGTYGTTVGLVSMGAVGRQVRELLRPIQVRVLAYDPFLGAEEAQRLRVQPAELEELFRNSDVVSLHAPLLPETRGLVSGALLESMRPSATFINTARGALVREAELIEALRRRQDLQAVLDVTDPEPPAAGSPLRRLPNVVLTPHIAGALGPERRRLGRAMVDELRRYAAGRPLRWELTRDQVARMATP